MMGIELKFNLSVRPSQVSSSDLRWLFDRNKIIVYAVLDLDLHRCLFVECLPESQSDIHQQKNVESSWVIY